MTQMYTERTFDVNPECASHVLVSAEIDVHDTHMAAPKRKKSATAPKETPSPEKAQFQPTFIKQWRKIRSMTQEDLAERIGEYLAKRGDPSGYTYASVGRLENGKIGYTQLVLEAAAVALGTDPASLLTRDPTDQSPMWTVWDQALPEERQLIEQQAEIVIRNRRKSA